jgi:hypothetical protein
LLSDYFGESKLIGLGRLKNMHWVRTELKTKIKNESCLLSTSLTPERHSMCRSGPQRYEAFAPYETKILT